MSLFCCAWAGAATADRSTSKPATKHSFLRQTTAAVKRFMTTISASEYPQQAATGSISLLRWVRWQHVATVVPPIGREEMSKNLGFLAHSPCLRYRGCPPMGMCRVTVKSSQPGRGRTLKMEWDGDSLIGT